LPLCPALKVGCDTTRLMPLSKVGVPSVTVAVPDVIFGLSVTLLPDATIVVSGFKSHSAPGICDVPVTASKVAEYGAKVMLGDHAEVVEATICLGFVDDRVYLVTCWGANPLKENCT